MIRCRFFGREGNLSGFCIKGHSGAGTAGTDIVCAAVSSAVYLVANTITEVLSVPAEIRTKDGLLELSVPYGENPAECQVLLLGLQLHLEALAQQYPDYITVTFSEV